MRIIKEKQLTDFCLYMKEAEHASATVSKYKRTIEDLMLWMGGREVTKELVVAWKEHILERNYAPATVNGMLTAVNVFFKHYPHRRSVSCHHRQGYISGGAEDYEVTGAERQTRKLPLQRSCVLRRLWGQDARPQI